jgi:translation initiation factor 2A
MPAKTTIFNSRGVAKHNFALAPRNTIQFSPQGRFVLVAGFGNLAGQMDIYDMDKDHAKITTVEASNASVCEWSPDAKYILTATTSPRLRVDNGIRIWHVGGNLMYNEDMHELYDVCWRPQPSTQLGDPFHPAPTAHPSAAAYLGARKVPSKPAGAYRPPGARGQGTPLAFKREDEGGAAVSRDGAPGGAAPNGLGKSRRRAVPGADPAEYLPPGAAPGGGVALPPGAAEPTEKSKSASKNKKKREARKTKEEAEENGAVEQPSRSPERRDKGQDKGQGQGRKGDAAAARKADKEDQTNGTAPPAMAAAAADDSANPSTQDKKIRGLLKKMRAIDELKMRVAGGEKLEDTQVKKIQTEDGVRKELEALGYS